MELLAFFANYPASLIGIEACGGAYHWTRKLIKLGHEVVLLNARHVKSIESDPEVSLILKSGITILSSLAMKYHLTERGFKSNLTDEVYQQL